jgi:hypothetical protein
VNDVAVIVPVLRRPHRAAPFMASLLESTNRASVYAVVSVDDAESQSAWLAAGASALSSWQTTFPEKVNLAYEMTGEPWLFLTGDDVVFHIGWLDELLRVAAETGAQVVGSNDLANLAAHADLAAVHRRAGRVVGRPRGGVPRGLPPHVRR